MTPTDILLFVAPIGMLVAGGVLIAAFYLPVVLRKTRSRP